LFASAVILAGLLSVISIATSGYLSGLFKRPPQTPVSTPAAVDPSKGGPTQAAPPTRATQTSPPGERAKAQGVPPADTPTANSARKPAPFLQPAGSSGRGKSKHWRRSRGASPSIWWTGDRSGRYKSRKAYQDR